MFMKGLFIHFPNSCVTLLCMLPLPHPVLQLRVPGRCRLCANHNRYVEIKGHKWYCPFKSPEHSCSKCEITRKRQFFMAEQQKLTREQQQQHHHLQGDELGGPVGAEGGRQAAVPPRYPAKPSDFPRMQELLEETNNILDPELFRQIDECVRPKVTHH